MARRIAGITVEIGGDTTKLTNALKNVDSQVRTTQSSLRDVNRLLKLDPKNTELLSQKHKLLGTSIEATKEKLNTLKAASEQAAATKDNYDAWKAKYDPIKTKIDETGKKLQELKEKDKIAKQQLSEGKISQAQYDTLQREIKDTENDLKTLRQQAKDVDTEFGKPISPEKYDALQREIIETEQDLKSLEKQAKDTPSSFQASMTEASGKLKEASTAVGNVGKAVMPVSLGVIGLGTAAVKTASDFDSAMSQVQATLGITADATTNLNGKTVNSIDALSKLAREMGEKTKYSASEAADAINILAMAGQDTNTIYQTLPATLSLAAAGGLEIAQAADIATGILAGFGMEASEASHVSDVLATTASSAKGSVSDFGAGLNTVAGQAKTTNQSLTDAATALGILGNHNIAAAEGGNMLQRVLKNLYQPTDKAKGVMQELGVSAYDASGKARPMQDVLQDLKGKLGMLNDEEKNQAMKKIFDSATLKGASALIEDSGEAFTNLKEKIENCEGSAEQMQETMGNNLAGQLKILQSQLQELAISVGTDLMPKIRAVVTVIQSLVDGFNGLSPAARIMIEVIGGVIAVMGPLLMIISGVLGALSTVTGFIGIATAPVLGIIAAVAAAIVIIALVVTHLDFFKKKLSEVGSYLSGAFSTAIAGATNLFSTIGNAIRNGVQSILSAVTEVLAKVKTVISGAFATLGNLVKVGILVIREVLSASLQLLLLPWTFLWVNFGTEITAAFQTIGNLLSDALTSMVSVIRDIWTRVVSVISPPLAACEEAVQTAWSGILTLTTTVFSAIKSAVSGGWNAVKSVTSSITKAVSSVASKSFTAMKSKATSIMNGIKSVFQRVWTAIKGVVSKAVSGIKSTFTKGLQGIKSAATGPLNAIKNAFTNTFHKAKNAVRSAINTMKGYMHFSWKLPHLKVPSVHVTGKFSINPPSAPHFSLSWHKDAMKDGLILNRPTIFGMTNGTLHGAGEAGSETVVGTQSLMGMIQSAVGNAQNAQNVYVTMNVDGSQDPAAWAQQFSKTLTRLARTGGI